MWTPWNLSLSTCSTAAQLMRMGACSVLLFPVVHNHLLCPDDIEGDVVVLAPQGQVSDLLPIGRLVVVADQLYHCWVFNLMMALELCLSMQSWVNREYRSWLSRTPEGPLCWESAWLMCCYLPFPPEGGPSGSPGSSCRGRCLVSESLAYWWALRALWCWTLSWTLNT